MYSTGGKKQYHKGDAHFINCWTLWCRQDSSESPKVLLFSIMFDNVSHFITKCSLCATSKLSNRKLRLYTPLSVPSRPWESILMAFVGGLPLWRKVHEYLYVVVDRFSKMCILTPCKKKITVEQQLNFYSKTFGFILVFLLLL